MTLKECYQLLGVAPSAKLEDIKRAYRRRAFELHPDLNPNLVDAGRQFQLLNEAYVNLNRVLSAKEQTSSQGAQARQRQQQEKEQQAKARAQEQAEQAKAKAQEQARAKEQAQAKADARQTGPSGPTTADEKKRKAADEAYARQEEVLQDILNDQFARRVFEDIYSEINKRQATPGDGAVEKPAEDKPVEPPKTKKLNVEWGNKFVNIDMTNGVGGMMRSWLRKQIDDELTVALPQAKLFPGARVRLQIRQGLGDVRVVEITLPADFRVGKAIRLKGMGKKVGKWTGDLYVTIQPQQ